MFNILFNFVCVALFFTGKGMNAVFIRNKETEIQVTAPRTGLKSGRV